MRTISKGARLQRQFRRLAMVHSIVRAHRGAIRADSQPSQGATFTVSLPI